MWQASKVVGKKEAEFAFSRFPLHSHCIMWGVGGGGGEKREKKKRRGTHAKQKDEKSTSEISTTYHIDYMGKVTSCFSFSMFLMTFKFQLNQKIQFHLTAT